MCCNGHSKPDNKADHVDESLVATPLPDGYWLTEFPFSTDAKLPDLVGYGLGFKGKPSAVKLFLNPSNTNSEGWKVMEVQSLEYPVAMVYADLTGDGFNDMIICDRYGPSINDLWDGETQNGGRVQWLRNPGNQNPSQPYWEAHHIGNSTGMHRLKVGHFTRSDILQVLGFPIISASSNFSSPAPIIIYTPSYGSDSSQGPESWSNEIVFASEFRLIHDCKLLSGANNGLDMAIVAGQEGITLIWFNEDTKKWAYNVIGTGLPKEAGHPYWGSGSIDVGRVGDDPVGYIATCEGFHGNTVSVYIKNSQAPSGIASLKVNVWTRVVIDNFGPLDTNQNTGTIHNVATIRVGKNDFDSFAIACMGAPVEKPENQGVYMYAPLNLAEGRFKKTKVTNESAARLAIAGFIDPNKHDIASISYYVPGYHITLDPPGVRINTLDSYNVSSCTSIVAQKLGKEALLFVPRPDAVPDGCVPTMPMLVIAGKKMTLVVLRPGAVINLGYMNGAKVIHGSINMVDKNGEVVILGIATAAKNRASTHILSEDGLVTAGGNGAVFLWVELVKNEFQGPYTTMSEVTTTNVFPSSPQVPANVRAMEFPFVKVDTLDWASSGLWNDFEFYNMTGFYVYFNDDAMQEVVHIQAWTLGIGETARFHNHPVKTFCEIHYCLANGGGSGGMRYFADDYTQPIDTDAELTSEYVEKNSTLLVVPSMYEHGPLWKIQPGTTATPQFRKNGTVDYPWHAWLASRFGEHKLPITPPLGAETQRFDLWLAFEFPPTTFQD